MNVWAIIPWETKAAPVGGFFQPPSCSVALPQSSKDSRLQVYGLPTCGLRALSATITSAISRAVMGTGVRRNTSTCIMAVRRRMASLLFARGLPRQFGM